LQDERKKSGQKYKFLGNFDVQKQIEILKRVFVMRRESVTFNSILGKLLLNVT